MDTLIDYLLELHGPTPYLVLLGILLLCGIGMPMPEDVTLFVGGLLAYYGVTDVWITIAVCLFGVMFGDSTIFFLGQKYGRRLTKIWIFHKLLPDHRLEEVSQALHRRGTGLIFLARFMPGLRAPIFFTAGTLKVPFRVFFGYDGAAALLSVPAIIGAVYYWGDSVDQVIRMIKKVENGIVFGILGLAVFFLIKWYAKKRRAQKTS